MGREQFVRIRARVWVRVPVFAFGPTCSRALVHQHHYSDLTAGTSTGVCQPSARIPRLWAGNSSKFPRPPPTSRHWPAEDAQNFCEPSPMAPSIFKSQLDPLVAGRAASGRHQWRRTVTSSSPEVSQTDGVELTVPVGCIQSAPTNASRPLARLPWGLSSIALRQMPDRVAPE